MKCSVGLCKVIKKNPAPVTKTKRRKPLYLDLLPNETFRNLRASLAFVNNIKVVNRRLNLGNLRSGIARRGQRRGLRRNRTGCTPDRTFYNLEASESGDWRSLCSSETSFDGLAGSKIVQFSVGQIQTSRCNWDPGENGKC